MSTKLFGSSRLSGLRLNAALALKSSHRSLSTQNSAHNLVEYKPIKVIGKGAFGVVFTARAQDGEVVAVKKVLQDPRYKNRELDIITLLDNENCVTLRQAFKSKGQKQNEVFLNIVMDYLPMTLYQFVINYRQERMYPPILYVKLFGFQLFAGLHYLHSIGITHRDIKPQNVVINPETGELKICDFGSAKMLHPGEKSVSYIASRFYRAPELVFDCTEYTSAIDIWAAGCVIAEAMMSGTPLFPGETSQDQLTEIMKVMGPPSKEDLASFPHNYEPIIMPEATTSLEKLLPKHAPESILDLLHKIFVYDPCRRPTALQCMKHPCFNDLFAPGIVLPNKNPFPNLTRNPPPAKMKEHLAQLNK